MQFPILLKSNFLSLSSAKQLLSALLIATTLPVIAAEVSDADLDKKGKPKASTKERYEKLVKELETTPPPPGTVICIGSSQMANWKTVAKDLAPLTVFNYGIGGSRMNQAADHYIPNLAIPFKPRAVILYEGSNDLAGGITPDQILKDFQRLHGTLHTALPATRLYVLGIVPSPGKRFDKIDEVKQTNDLLKKECESSNWIKFIDTTSPLIGADGTPKMEYFIPGNIHMTPAGYEVWKTAIAPVVMPVEKEFEKK